MNWPNILDNGIRLLKQNDNDIFHFRSLQSNQSRVSFLIDRQDIYLNELKSFHSIASSEKNSQLSEDNRKNGNKYYAQKLNKKAFNSFNHALLYSNDLKSTLLAYSNRSAVFYDEKLYEKCLIDIEKAFNIYFQMKTCQDLSELVFKLLNRKKNCYFYLGQREQLIQMKAKSTE